MKWTVPGLLFPQELLLLALVFAGALIMLGMKGVAARIVLFVVAFALAPLVVQIFDALFETLPVWTIALALLVIGVALLRGLLLLAFGKGVADHAIGELLAGFLLFAIRLPFRALRSLLKFVLGRVI